MNRSLIFCVWALVVSMSPLRGEGPWHGTWDTTYGQLRLVQDGLRVYGDYQREEGYLEGRIAKDNPSICRGTYQRKDGRWGLFEFKLADDSFEGGWTWEDNIPKNTMGSWNGKRTASAPGPLIHAQGKKSYWAKPYEERFPDDIGRWIVSASDSAPVADTEPEPKENSQNNTQADSNTTGSGPWNGTWDTTFGQLRLVQVGLRVYGDYQDAEGYLEGRLAEDNKAIYRGTFQRKDGAWGLFEFNMAPDRRRFQGGWNWEDTFPSRTMDTWNGQRTSTDTGQLIFAVGKKFFWAKPYENRFPENIIRWIGSLPPQVEPEPQPSPQNNPQNDSTREENTRRHAPLTATLRLRLYGIHGWTARNRAAGEELISGSFYVNASMVDRQGNTRRLSEQNGVPEMIWKRDAHNSHRVLVKSLMDRPEAWAEKDGRIFAPNPTPAMRNFAEWERREDRIRFMNSQNLFSQPLDVYFDVPLEELNQDGNKLRVQLSGFLFEVDRRKRETERGRVEAVWLYSKDPMKRSGDFKTLQWSSSESANSRVTWRLEAATSFSYE